MKGSSSTTDTASSSDLSALMNHLGGAIKKSGVKADTAPASGNTVISDNISSGVESSHSGSEWIKVSAATIALTFISMY